MGIVRKVLLGLENRAGCIFSLLLNAFEWRLRFKILNWGFFHSSPEVKKMSRPIRGHGI
jgi:hypothetical protein